MPQIAIDWIKRYDIAHRGLFIANSLQEENTLAAIQSAVDRGFAVEIDVQVTAEDMIVVFHDTTLDRLTQCQGKIASLSYRELQKIPIGITGAPMPLLTDVLDIVNQKVPLYIEVKTNKDLGIQTVCAGIRHALEGYNGPVAIMSFDHRVIKWFKAFDDKIIRGLVLGRQALLSIKNRLKLHAIVYKVKPHFLACDIRLLPNPFTESWRKKGYPLLTWTVREIEMENIAKRYADRMIFEHPIIPGQLPEI